MDDATGYARREISGLASNSDSDWSSIRDSEAAARRGGDSGRQTTSRLLLVLTLLVVIALGPIAVGRFIYYATYNELKAGYDVATEGLSKLKPRLDELEMASRLVAKRVEPSVVSIYRPGGFGREGQGSGVIVDAEGYIVTNFHVVRDAPSIQVRLSDGRRTTAEVVGDDPETDLAILKIELTNLVAAEWGDSEKLEVGDLVWALGSPFGLDRSLTFGIVSAKARHGGSRFSAGLFQEYLQTDAAVNPGNSGGPLVNIEGKVVGINTAIVGPSYQGISFAIPSRLVHEKYDELRTTGRIERAWLGVAPLPVPDELRRQFGLDFDEGVLIGEVEPDSPAGRAGFRLGDIILQWNDHDAVDPNLLSRAIAATEIGSTAKAVVLRPSADASGEAERMEIDVQVERRPRLIPRRRQGR
jgi:S1-C subfamily serine protease